jgi:hypothetical protein
VAEDVSRNHVPHDDLSVITGRRQQVGRTLGNREDILFVTIDLYTEKKSNGRR